MVKSLEAFGKDVETYSDLHTDDALAQIKNMRGLAVARSSFDVLDGSEDPSPLGVALGCEAPADEGGHAVEVVGQPDADA